MALENLSAVIGQRFGSMVVTADLGMVNRHRKVLAQCDCGTEKPVRLSHLRAGRTTSCGCYNRVITAKRVTTHGLSNHPLFRIWCGIIQRCYDPNTIGWKNYGGRGVRVCDEWRYDFKAFYEWAITNGWMKGMQLDKDKLASTRTGNLYCPEYCCFLTVSENMRNRSDNRLYEYKGEIKTMTEWCELFEIKISTVAYRLKRGLSFEDALTKPKYKGKVIEYNGQKKPLHQWCKELNLPYSTIEARLRVLKFSVKQAFEQKIKNRVYA